MKLVRSSKNEKHTRKPAAVVSKVTNNQCVASRRSNKSYWSMLFVRGATKTLPKTAPQHKYAAIPLGTIRKPLETGLDDYEWVFVQTRRNRGTIHTMQSAGVTRINMSSVLLRPAAGMRIDPQNATSNA
ncbi:hypothetical protein CY34DRAFT_149056 [Suillus luteus UH-Slu-Lm8-n1]|uniref:Unplaced genomic scaffold CY34scaffold_11, whole genome shotgun sequence n=1 Tax=Suillus luteus UH-Slu-Lm8-n1 TaxID=930992 RepID=A0A0D0ACJ4_9AGAM|nr:hypothetical protein CY34DRAFT_149056 [Suillus luteus UH-Slu-Lm8-n1]